MSKPRLRPFFKYFGAKYRISPRYPAPTQDTIVEPFAGAAGYSVCHHDRKVILIDKFPTITGIWEYLINVSESEFRSLPMVGPDDDVRTFLQIPQEARDFIGFWLSAGVTAPYRKPCAWMRGKPNGGEYWNEGTKQRIADQLKFIRHWKVIHGSYEDAPDIEATWYVDPPYQGQGVHYKHSSKALDFDRLGAWCRSRRGQIMVCEGPEATWLPFRPYMKAKTTTHGLRKEETVRRMHCQEMIWTNFLPEDLQNTDRALPVGDARDEQPLHPIDPDPSNLEPNPFLIHHEPKLLPTVHWSLPKQPQTLVLPPLDLPLHPTGPALELHVDVS